MINCHLMCASVLALAIHTAACSGDGPANELPASAGASATASTPATTQKPDVTVETLSSYERGLRKEIEAVRAAQQRAGAAKTPQERGEAIQASFEHVTIPQGAEAAGLPVEQYRAVRETVNGIFETLDFQGKIDGPLSMDLSRADDATKQRLARDPFADLAPASAATLRAQMNRLVPVWIEYVSLTAVAG
jgi:hypothetical protein